MCLKSEVLCSMYIVMKDSIKYFDITQEEDTILHGIATKLT